MHSGKLEEFHVAQCVRRDYLYLHTLIRIPTCARAGPDVSRFEQTAALPFGTISTGLINKGHMIEKIAYRGDALSGKNSPVPLSIMEKLPKEGQQQLMGRNERP